LAFSLCANPVVTKSERNGKPERHDVIMNAKKQLEQQDEARVHPAELIQNVGCDWLTKRAAKHGFQLEQMRVDGYRQHRFKKAPSGQPVCFSTLEFNGLLTVTNPELFHQALCHGIGPAKSFGCGLLLVRRVAIP
jgi:CRISPR system Cascade subunit CasE